MCLSKKYDLRILKKRMKNGTGEGYKAFDLGWKKKIIFPFQGDSKNGIPIGKWIDEKQFRRPLIEIKKYIYIYRYISGKHYSHYPLGFHICLDPIEASFYGEKVFHVLFKDVVAYGEQREDNVARKIAVARKMKIISPADEIR